MPNRIVRRAHAEEVERRAAELRAGRPAGSPRRLKNMHEALALSGLIAIAGHGLLLLGDSYLRPGLAGIALPFAMAGQPVWTGLGIIGGWLAVYGLGILHALGSGSDARAPWFLGIVAATAAPIVFAGVYKALPAPPKASRAAV